MPFTSNPDAIITKALFQDRDYFRTTWRGHTLAGNLDYGGEMSYGGIPQPRLVHYKQQLTNSQLSLGFWAGSPSRSPAKDVRWIRDKGYAGVMLFEFEARSGVDFMGELVNAWYGPGNWNPPS